MTEATVEDTSSSPLIGLEEMGPKLTIIHSLYFVGLNYKVNY